MVLPVLLKTVGRNTEAWTTAAKCMAPVAWSMLIYLWAKPLLGQETASWLCILAAAPIAAAGFLSYDGLPFEKFVIIVLESTILYSGWRVWKTELRPKQKGKVKKIAFK